MTQDFIEDHYETIRHHVDLCLKKGKKNEAIIGNKKSLPDMIALAYFGLVFRSMALRSVADVKGNERDIEKMVDFFFEEGAS